MNRVTITGADDKTPVSALIDLSAEFPFVEWGILVSKRGEGGFRFPSRDWISTFLREIKDSTMKVSMHVCGEWVTRILRGKMDWNAFPDVWIVADRIQINTHAEEHVSTVAAFDWMAERSAKQFIIQLDGVNDHVLDAALSRDINAVGLFDGSHGAGVLPKDWPTPHRSHRSVYLGYAGGLGPDNVADQVSKITNARKLVCWPAGSPLGDHHGWWIDMEGRVRTDEQLDLAKVRKVLEICAPHIKD